jgi:hypothetical protein
MGTSERCFDPLQTSKSVWSETLRFNSRSEVTSSRVSRAEQNGERYLLLNRARMAVVGALKQPLLPWEHLAVERMAVLGVLNYDCVRAEMSLTHGLSGAASILELKTVLEIRRYKKRIHEEFMGIMEAFARRRARALFCMRMENLMKREHRTPSSEEMERENQQGTQTEAMADASGCANQSDVAHSACAKARGRARLGAIRRVAS